MGSGYRCSRVRKNAWAFLRLAPVTVSSRALEVYQNRSKRASGHDLDAILSYIDGDGGRSYHHTAPISMVFALDAGLRNIGRRFGIKMEASRPSSGLLAIGNGGLRF